MKRALPEVALLIALSGCSRGNLDVVEWQPPDGGGSAYDGGPFEHDDATG